MVTKGTSTKQRVPQPNNGYPNQTDGTPTKLGVPIPNQGYPHQTKGTPTKPRVPQPKAMPKALAKLAINRVFMLSNYVGKDRILGGKIQNQLQILCWMVTQMNSHVVIEASYQ